MKNNKRGFTLIEVLIVVLIVAILSAIAVPQYQKAVLKSRFSSLMPTAKSIRDGNEIYFMTNGRYADAVSKLDVTATNNDDMTLTVSDDSDYAYTMATRPNINNNLIMYQKHSANFPGEIHCEALEDNTLANWVCENGLHGTSISGSVTDGYNTYVLEGSGMGLFGGADDNTLTCDKATNMGYTCSITENAQGQQEKKICQNYGDKTICRTTTYNEDGGYTTLTCQTNDANVCTSTGYLVTYDANGKRTANYNCVGWNSDGSCQYSSYSSGGNASYYTYDANGNMLSRRVCSNLANDGSCKNQYTNEGDDFTYDANGNLLTQRSCSSVNSSGSCTAYFGGYDYTYDENGNLTSRRNCASFNPDGSCSRYESYNNDEYTYDANGNKIFERECKSFNSDGSCNPTDSRGKYYMYDENGNQISMRFCQTVATDGSCSQYASFNNEDYTYDANGNMLSRRVCSNLASDGSCNTYSSNTTYYYDDDGIRIAVQSCSGSNVNTTTGECISSDGRTVIQYDVYIK